MCIILNERIKSILKDEKVFKIFDTLCKNNIEVRIVGGCVRDALLEEKISDIDFAVNADPKIVWEILQNSGIKVIPTGLQHGTITAVIDKKPLEITTLRKDLKTDGRHAEVSFTNNWKEDASRRDFTINALYLDKNGTIYDFFDGINDLKNGVVKFIGDPDKRIQEDYLRILRYYRFFLRFGKIEHKKSFEATLNNSDGLKQLSLERIQLEIFKILEHPNPVPVIKLMDENDIFMKLFDTNADYSDLYKLILLQDNDLNIEYETLILSRLYSVFPKEIRFFENKFRLSNKFLKCLESVSKIIEMDVSNKSLFFINYYYGLRVATIFLLIKLSRNAEEMHQYSAYLDKVLKFSNKLPVKGKDILELGLCQGSEVGKLLKECEKWWIENKGEPNRIECLAFLQSRL